MQLSVSDRVHNGISTVAWQGIAPRCPFGYHWPMGQAYSRIRQADPRDVEGLIEISLRTIRASYASFLGRAAVEAFIGSGAVEKFVRDNVAIAVVVTLDDELAGYAVSTGDHVDELIIDVAFHRRGLGSMLLAHLERELFKGHDALMLESFRDNDQANAFYDKHGWQVTGAYRDQDYGVDMIRLRKEALDANG